MITTAGETRASFHEVSAQVWDALVIGAGPAGALAARELARQGRSVLLVDRARFPRPKVCGCCINRGALATLNAVGLQGLAQSCGAVPLQRVRLATDGRQAVLPLVGGVALSRSRFDAALVEAAVQAGARVIPETLAQLGPCQPHARQVRLRHRDQETTASASLVIAANGLGGNLLAAETPSQAKPGSRLGAGTILQEAPAAYEPGTVFMACGVGGYAGLVRLEDGRLDVAAALDPVYVAAAGGLGRAAEGILHQARLPTIPSLTESRWRGTPLLSRRLQTPSGRGVLAIGDAAGYVEPFTGEGIAWALASAAAVPSFWALPDGERGRAWNHWYRRQIARRQWLCRLVAAALRRPRLVRTAVTLLAHAPLFAAPALRYLQRSRLKTLGHSGLG